MKQKVLGEKTDKLGLEITTRDSLESDSPKDTIVEYGENFKKLEKEIATAGGSMSDLNVGEKYRRGFILWNNHPAPNSFIGWVNGREGYHEVRRKPDTIYRKGDKISDGGTAFIYECVKEGRTADSLASLNETSTEFYEQRRTTFKWRPDRNYKEGDVVFPTDGTISYYLIVEISGTTGDSEPNWLDHPAHTHIVDGSVTWRRELNPKWKRTTKNSARFLPFGAILDTGDE